MGPFRFVPLVVKQVSRRAVRAALTVLGVAAAMFLFSAIQALRSGAAAATEETGRDTRLIVYRENRFCPATSRLPQSYESRIARLPGVTEVLPMQVVVTNCRTSLDVVTFRGVPAEEFASKEAAGFRVVGGSLADWTRRQDAALLGRTLADRRGLRPGDRFVAAGITVSVAAVFDSDEPQHLNVAYVHLPFLQRQPGIDRQGTVTQFNVKISDPSRIDAVSQEIDGLFRTDQSPTSTRSEKAFTARAAGDVMELLGFASWVAAACVAAVLALVANAIVLSVQDRVKDFAVMETLGYPASLLAVLVVAEGAVLSLFGGLVGVAAAAAVLRWKSPSLSNEGLSIEFSMDLKVWGIALAISIAVGVLAGLVPALRVARQSIAGSFRAV